MSAVDPFARVPHRFTDALRRREVTQRQYALGVYLIATADFRTGYLSRTLAVLADECGYASPATSDLLSRDLTALERLGWIRQHVVQGQRRPRTVELTGLLPTSTPARLPHEFRTEGADVAEVTSTHAGRTGVESPHESADSAAFRLLHASSPQEVDVEEENPLAPLKGGTRRCTREIRSSVESLASPESSPGSCSPRSTASRRTQRPRSSSGTLHRRDSGLRMALTALRTRLTR